MANCDVHIAWFVHLVVYIWAVFVYCIFQCCIMDSKISNTKWTGCWKMQYICLGVKLRTGKVGKKWFRNSEVNRYLMWSLSRKIMMAYHHPANIMGVSPHHAVYSQSMDDVLFIVDDICINHMFPNYNFIDICIGLHSEN